MITILEHNYPNVVEDIVANHLRVQPSDEELYTSAVQCVHNAFDVASDYCNRVLIPSTASMTIGVEDGVAQLPTAPISEVVSVKANGVDVEYRLIGNDKTAYITELPAGVTSIEVVAKVGYSKDIPGAIYRAVALIAGTFFEFRSDNLSGTTTSELPMSAKSLLNAYRSYPYGL